MNISRLPWIAVACLALAACSGPRAESAAAAPGVTCGDNAGDAARIQAVVDASAPGAVIQIGGTCLLTRGIVLPGDRTYAGGSTTGTVLRQDGAMSFVLASTAYADNSTTTGDPVQIRDLTVACDGSGDTDGIIALNWQADVQQVDVQGCGGSGIVDTSVTQNGTTITNTSVNSRFENDFISNSGQYGFEVRDPANAVTDGFFTDNQVAYSGADGGYLENSAGWVISGNCTVTARTASTPPASTGRRSPATTSRTSAPPGRQAPGTGSSARRRAVRGPSSPATRCSTTPARRGAPAMSSSPSR